MLLTIDIGNTHIVLGVMNKMEVLFSFRMTTQVSRTSDEYGVTMVEMLNANGLSTKDIDDIIVSSVVPNIMFSLKHSITRYFNKIPYAANLQNNSLETKKNTKNYDLLKIVRTFA